MTASSKDLREIVTAARPLLRASDPFGEAIVAQLPRIRAYARALKRDYVAADDLVQDTLVRALSRKHLFEPGTKMREWLFSIMRNTHVDDVRHGVRHGTAVDLDAMANVLSVEAKPDVRFLFEDLGRALETLAPETAQALLLIAHHRLTYTEAAERVNVPVGTIRSRLSRGRERLRQVLNPPT
jgi:RNA polymerase sigma-70 factor, ECF subfamily